ncbi:hypothetical protein PC114_g28052 [Phytophthora cactorum]|nr:hypothetical protein PC114_g28052 [Phytophthora cactorum]
MLPGETTLTLLKSKKMEANPVGRREVPCRSPRGLRVEAHGCADFSLQKNRPPAETHALWVRRTEKLILTLLSNRRGDLAKVPIGDLPREAGYVRPKSRRYKDWQVLAYEGLRDPTLFGSNVSTMSAGPRPNRRSSIGRFIQRQLTFFEGRAMTRVKSRAMIPMMTTMEMTSAIPEMLWDNTEAATKSFETCSSDVANSSYVNCDVSDPAETDLGDMVVNSHVTSGEPSLSGDEDPRNRNGEKPLRWF